MGQEPVAPEGGILRSGRFPRAAGSGDHGLSVLDGRKGVMSSQVTSSQAAAPTYNCVGDAPFASGVLFAMQFETCGQHPFLEDGARCRHHLYIHSCGFERLA